MAKKAASDHDSFYHRLFGDPRLVAQLLRDFIPGPMLDGFDLDRTERLNPKFHAQIGVRREADTIWRIPRHDGGDTYLVLLLEFQSRSDSWMALRVLVYVGLIWQQLITEKRLLPDGRLPPVLPVVLYNGAPRWAGPLSLRDLIGLEETSPLWSMQPQGRYHIIDEGAIPEDELAKLDTLPALLFRAERSDPQQASGLAKELLAWFRRHPGFDELQSFFLELLRNVQRTIDPKGVIPESLEEMANMQSMLVTRAETLKQQWIQEGKQEGRAALLTRLLERRFGPLPDWATDRIRTAESAALDEWGLRVLDGERLEDVLR